MSQDLTVVIASGLHPMRSNHCCIERPSVTASGVDTRPLDKPPNAVFADILSQAITGELVGMANYAAMVRLQRDAQGQVDALKHAANEMQHAQSFRRAARDLGVEPIVNPEAPYWHRIRAAFLRHADACDGVACLVIQEVMLESLAVSMYDAVAEVAPDALARVCRAIGSEEAVHVEHAVEELRASRAQDPDAFDSQLERLTAEVMGTMAEMLAAQDSVGHCGLCRGGCVKRSLPQIGLDRASLRGRALNQYLRTLDRIGVCGERSLAWIARLPA